MNSKIIGMTKSKTMWFNAFVIFFGAMAANTAAFEGVIPPAYFPLVISLIGAVNLGLRFVTTQSVEEKGNA